MCIKTPNTFAVKMICMSNTIFLMKRNGKKKNWFCHALSPAKTISGFGRALLSYTLEHPEIINEVFPLEPTHEG
jgi:hypothetical protein